MRDQQKGNEVVICVIQRNAGSMGVRKVQGVHQDFAFLMAVARGAIDARAFSICAINGGKLTKLIHG